MPSEKEVVTMVPPPTVIKTRPEPLPILEEELMTLPADDIARASDPVGLLGTTAQSLMLTSRRPTVSSYSGYIPEGEMKRRP